MAVATRTPGWVVVAGMLAGVATTGAAGLLAQPAVASPDGSSKIQKNR